MIIIMNIIYWTWSKKGEFLEKSQKKIKVPIQPEIKSLEEKIIINSHQNLFVEENKREQNSERMSQRKLVTNRGINPFHVKNNYINDLSVQDNFLRPKNSNFNVKNKDLNDD